MREHTHTHTHARNLISFKSEGEKKTFSDIQKLREFVITRPALQEILKEILRLETQIYIKRRASKKE